MKILIVDDEIRIREVVKEYALVNGYVCDEASDGKSAVNMALASDYDCIILDIMMPVMDGYQALMGIRNLEKGKNIPEDKRVKVIMATALNEEKNVKMAFDLGCTIYSGKPIDQAKFEQALKKIGLIDEK